MMRLALALALLGAAFQEKEPDYAAIGKTCGSAIDWIADSYTPGDDGPGRDKMPDADRAALFDQAKTKAAAADRLILWYCHRIAGPQMYRAQLPDNYMKQAVWSDPDVIDLVARKFVPLRLACDSKLGKLVAPDVVEPAVVLLSPDGTIVHTIERIRTFNADWMLAQLSAVLEKHEKQNRPVTPKDGDPLDKAEEHLRAGDLTIAAGLLAAPGASDPARAAYLQALVARRRRQADAALAALELAKAGKDELKPLVAVERGLVQLRARRFDDALKSFEDAAKSKSARQAEAKYWAGWLENAKGRETVALQKWARLVREHPATTWGAKAAANLSKSRDTTSEGAALHLFEDPCWGVEAAYASATTTSLPREEKDLPEVVRRAVEFLLAGQRENGAWTDTRYAYWDGPHILPNVRMSITAAASAALLEWRDVDPKRIDAALAKAEKYLVDEAQMARGKNEECYADAYRIQYWSRKWRSTKEASKRSAAVKAIAAAVEGLAKSQKAGGSWAHEYPNPFCTAAVLNSFYRAVQCKLEIPGRLVGPSAESIKKCRGADGGYSYSDGRPASGAKDAMARMPVCELALWMGKLATLEQVAASVDNFFAHLDKLEKIRKCDFHTDGELGGFFFWHGLFHTSETVEICLKDKAKADAESKLRAHVLKVQELDGSFVDDHELGKSYGTAMALLTLKNAAGNPTK